MENENRAVLAHGRVPGENFGWADLPAVLGTCFMPDERSIELGYRMWIGNDLEVVATSRSVTDFMQKIGEFVADFRAKPRFSLAGCSVDQTVITSARFLHAVRQCVIDDYPEKLFITGPAIMEADFGELQKLKTGIKDLCMEFIHAHQRHWQQGWL